MTAPAFSVCILDWDAAGAHARRIREAVFVLEQGVPRELELDDQDAHSDHALAYAADGNAVGTGRLLPDGHIGRMAVLMDSRGKGAGALLLNALVEQARRRGHTQALLNAQIRAVEFYRRFGFKVYGVEFIEAGIPHVAMSRALIPDRT